MATSIESKLSLALAVKLKAIFEQPDKTDKFLCFPKGIAFTYDYLKFMLPPGQSGLDANVQHNNKCDFARIMNMSFNDSAQYVPDASVFLWESFENILKNSTFPETTLTEQEEKQLVEAKKFLVIESTDENGFVTSVPTPAFNAYIQYKTLCDKANNFYLDEKITVENATGQEGEILKKKWQEYREKQLLEVINQANNDWNNLGYKPQIENYTVVKKSLEQKKYVNLVTNSYLNDLDQSDLPDLATGLPAAKITFYSPNDISDKTVPWISIHLTRDEINSFVAQASPELKAAFNEGEGNDDIEAVSLEYNQVAVMRPWWKSDYFTSRYWRLTDNTVVSDGNTPSKGKIPAYISSMIVVRNLTITRKKTVGAQSAAPLVIPILSNFSVRSATPVSSYMATGKQTVMLKSRITTTEEHSEIRAVNTKFKTARVNAGFKPNMIQLISTENGKDPVLVNDEQVLVRKRKYEHLKYTGTTIGTPIIHIPINPEPRSPPVGSTPAHANSTIIDLVQLAGDPQTRWASGQLIDEHNTIEDANLTWMLDTGSLGSVKSIPNATLEDGQIYPSVLFTHPMWVGQGTIKGWLAWRAIGVGARLQAKIGFLQGANGSDGVTFWIWLHHRVNGTEQWQPIYQKFKAYSQSLEAVDIDLSAYAGQQISIELRVDTGPSSGQDWAAWVNPVITLASGQGLPQQTELITETYPFDGVFVLAYMCKRVSKSPDPDLSLKWP